MAVAPVVLSVHLDPFWLALLAIVGFDFIGGSIFIQHWDQGSSGTPSSLSSIQVAPNLPFIQSTKDKEVENSPSWTALPVICPAPLLFALGAHQD